MTLTRLRTNRLIWSIREKSNYKKWHFFRYESKAAEATRLANRSLYWNRYEKSRTKRAWYDQQIAQKTKNAVATSVSRTGVNFIKKFEGYVGHIYNDSVGVPTVGYGHTENVHPGAIWIRGQQRAGQLTEAEATILLEQDLNKNYAPAVRSIGVHLNQHQFDALVSFVYNVGTGGVASTTTVGRELRAHNYLNAANGLLLWDKARGNILEGLRIRRVAERTMFLS